MPVDSCLVSYSIVSFHRINLAMDQAYRAVNKLSEQHPFLLSAPMKSQFQTLYNACSEYAIQDMVINGRFPNQVKAQFKLNVKKNHNYLQLDADGCALTFSSCNTLKPERLPRPSIFRQEQSFENQSSLFRDLDEKSADTSYGIILHKRNGVNGSAVPSMALGIPDREYRKWLDYRTLAQILSLFSMVEITKEDNEYSDHLRNEISKKAEINVGGLIISVK